MASYEAALASVLAAAPQPRIETISLERSIGRILARDLRADRDIPPFDRAALDGYAFAAGSRLDDPRGLLIAGEVAAGTRPPRRLAPGSCVRIWTGAPVPAGAAGIVAIERSREERGRAHLESSAATVGGKRPGIADRGEDARRGDVVLEAGRRVGAGEVAVLASIGRSRVPAYAEAETSILVTGHEIVPFDAKPSQVQIRSANDSLIAALFHAVGARSPRLLGIAEDDPSSLRRAIRRGLRGDLLVITGGVSAGALDFVPGVLREIGAKIVLRQVAIRPGKPFLFATVRKSGRQTAVFCLPGNPVSSFVTAVLFLLPYIRAFRGETRPAAPALLVRIGAALRRQGGLLHFVPCRIEWKGGRLSAAEVPMNGSGDFVSAAGADGFLMVPGDGAVHPAGADLQAIPIPGREPVMEER